MKENRSNA
jgi:hypothetical protein